MAVIKMDFLSKSLGMQTTVTICLPTYSFADSANGIKSVYKEGLELQTLWLFHGGNGDDSDYVNFTNIVRYADDNKLAVIMPCDYNMAYNDFSHAGKYFTYVVEELPQLCRAFFPLSDKREDNFVGGLSMGTRGAMKAAMLYPERYAGALIMSGTGGLKLEKPNKELLEWQEKMKESGAVAKPLPAGIIEEQNEVGEFAKKLAANGTELPKLFFTWGADDIFVRSTAKDAVDFFTELGFDVFSKEVPGFRHEWPFWDLALKDAIYEWLPIRHSVIYPED